MPDDTEVFCTCWAATQELERPDQERISCNLFFFGKAGCSVLHWIPAMRFQG